jgi:ubiquinone/menaquinone biosynthesis C-methylase UbiE/N-acyl-L-homoserine lactone synthetase
MFSAFFWNLYAQWYDLLRTLYPYQYLHHRIVVLLDLIPHLRILDFGCGTGNTIEKIIKVGVFSTKIVGLDRSAPMLSRARKKVINTNVTFTHAIGQGERFDRIISINSFYVLENHEEVVKDWYARLEEGGLLIIANPFKPKLFLIFQEHFQALWTNKDWLGVFGFLVRLPLWLCLIASNLVIAKLATKKVYTFLSPDDLEQMFVRVGFTRTSKEIIYGGTCVLFCFQKEIGGGVRRAQTTAELEIAFRLRYNVYCEELGSLHAASYPEGLESDHFDDFAVHFIALREGKIHGYVRLVRGPGGNLLLEERFTLPSHIHKNRTELMEISRWIVSAPFRGTGLWFLLGHEAANWAKRNGYSKLVMVARENLWEGLKKRGWRVALWGSYQQYHDTISAPGTLECRTL